MRSARTTSGRSPGRRSQRRKQVDAVTCDLGGVVDLSMSGVRLRSRRRPPINVGTITLLRLEGHGTPLEVRGRLQWVRRTGLFGWEMGFKLASSSAAIRNRLEILLGQREPGPQTEEPAEQTTHATTTAVQASLPLNRYYTLLGLRPGATMEQVRAAYHRQARQHHPDLNKSKGAAAKFIEIKEAYDVLRRSADDARDAA